MNINLLENIRIIRGKRPTPLSNYETNIHNKNSIPYPIQSDIDKETTYLSKFKKCFLINKGFNFHRCLKGDLLITASCDIGNALELELEEAFIDDKFLILKPNEFINKKYLKYWIIKNKNNIKKLSYGTTFSVLYIEKFKDFLKDKYFPSQEKQFKISNFILLLEKNIELNVKKLQLLEQRLKYYSNNLLKANYESKLPCLRFSEFNLKLKKESLDQISKIFGVGIDKKINSNDKHVNLVNYMDVYKNTILNSDYKFKTTTSTINEIKKYQINYGDILITPSSETKMDIGIVSTINFAPSTHLLYSYHLNLIRANLNKINHIFLTYFLKNSNVRKYFYSVCQGSTRFTLSINDIKKIEILIPIIREQNKIVKFLTLLEKNIKLMSKKIEILKQLKTYYLNSLM